MEKCCPQFGSVGLQIVPRICEHTDGFSGLGWGGNENENEHENGNENENENGGV